MYVSIVYLALYAASLNSKMNFRYHSEFPLDFSRHVDVICVHLFTLFELRDGMPDEDLLFVCDGYNPAHIALKLLCDGMLALRRICYLYSFLKIFIAGFFNFKSDIIFHSE